MKYTILFKKVLLTLLIVFSQLSFNNVQAQVQCLELAKSIYSVDADLAITAELFAQNADHATILQSLAGFKAKLTVYSGDEASNTMKSALSQRGHLIENDRITRPETTGRSGDPVYFVQDSNGVRHVVKVYSKSISDLSKELIGLATFRGAGLKKSTLPEIKDIFMLRVQDKEYPVLVTSYVGGRDLTQTVKQLGDGRLNMEDMLVTMQGTAEALAEFHRHFLWTPEESSPHRMTTKNYESKKAQELMNSFEQNLPGLQREFGFTKAEGVQLVSYIQNIIQSYLRAPVTAVGYIHGDLNAGNIIYNLTTKQTAFIDTQLSINNFGPLAKDIGVHGIGDPMSDVGRLMAALTVEAIENGTPLQQIEMAKQLFLERYFAALNKTQQEMQPELQYFQIRFFLQQFIGQIYLREPRVKCELIQRVLVESGIRQVSSQALCR